MNELLVTIMLIIPAPNKMVDWTLNEVPTQIQVVHESGLEVSYSASKVPCHVRPKSPKEMVFRTSDIHCYLVFDINTPRFVRHPHFWHKIQLQKKTKNRNYLTEEEALNVLD